MPKPLPSADLKPGSGSKAATAAAGPSPAVMATYARQDIVFERGEGAWLVSTSGERYLDFASGVAVNALGHAHPRLVAALTGQAGKLWHTSNLYRVAGQERLAERLARCTFAERIFFCNSGAEACEGALKAARRWQYVCGRPERWRTITFDGAFHGRTLATIAAGGNPKYLEGFGRPADGFDQVAFGDLEAAKSAIGPETAAIMIEPIQGEGGVRVASAEFLAGLRRLCDTHGLLLILDEVQCGMGRTGKLFAHEWAGVRPDLLAAAKGLGGGFPVGAILATAEAAKGMTAGTHGSTFGGNPLAMAVANAVLDVVQEAGFLERVIAKGRALEHNLQGLKARFPSLIDGVRGQGLLLGLKLKGPTGEAVAALLDEKMLAVPAAENVLRIVPPLTVKDDELAEGAERLARALARLTSKSPKA
jgi:acetylornithine/N-succinyldiaminopimelate aminotransferase